MVVVEKRDGVVDSVVAGVIGLGVGEQHIHGLRRHPACRVAALCDIDPAKLDMARRRYPELRRYDHAEALIDDPEIDLVVVASYDDAHHAQVIRAINAGKHVFVEKPLCTRSEEMNEIVEALGRNPNVRLSSNTILRKSPRFIQLYEEINKGTFGDIYYAEADYNYGRLNKLTSGWRGRIADYSVIVGGGVHMIDLLIWLIGRQVVEVYALGNRICSRESSFHGMDMVMASLRFDNDVIAKVSANFGCVYPHFHRLSIYGTAATFENGMDHARLYRSRDPQHPPLQIDAPYPGVAKGDLIPGFVDAALGRSDPEVQEADVFATLGVCFAIDQSLRENRPVTVVRPDFHSASSARG